MISSKELDICFVKDEINQISKSKCCDSSENLVRLNNYDHVTVDLFKKIKIVHDNPQLSWFKKPTPKICLACCKYFTDLQLEDDTKNKRTYSTLTPECSASATDTDTSFSKLLHEIKTRHFTDDEINILVQAVGERVAPLANKHVAHLNKKNLGNRLEHMTTITYESYWHNTFGPFKYFLLGLIDGIRYVKLYWKRLLNLHYKCCYKPNLWLANKHIFYSSFIYTFRNLNIWYTRLLIWNVNAKDVTITKDQLFKFLMYLAKEWKHKKRESLEYV